jgi:cytochrome c oxidase subunit 2
VPGGRSRARLRSVGALATAVLLGGCARAGTMAPRGADADIANSLWWFMLWFGGAITVGWAIIFFVGLFRRHRPDATEEDDARLHRWFIIGGGLVLPSIALGAVFVVDLVALDSMPDGDEVVVDATGYRFWWEFEYPDPGFVTANEMYIPTGTDVQVRLHTDDVIHSFWVPQLSGKRDMVPNRVNELTLHADEPGRYFGECTEFCGIQHANMQFHVVAVPPDEYEDWLERMAQPAAEPDTAAEQAGLEAFNEYSCAACHAIRGTDADGQAGPALTHFALREQLGAGVAPNDRGHLGGWIVNAQGLKPGNLMPPIPVEGEDLSDLITYLLSLE